jgi:hypothetical protein
MMIEIKEVSMPGWTGCDVCDVIDALRVALGTTMLPDGARVADLNLRAVEARLHAEKDAPLAEQALMVAEGLHEAGKAKLALKISEAIPRIITPIDVSGALLLAQAQIVRGRSLDALGKHTKASSAFATAAQFYMLAGQLQGA